MPLLDKQQGGKILINRFWDQVLKDFFNIEAADHPFPIEAI